MKNIGKILVKVVLVIVLFTSATVALSSFGVKSVSEAKAAVSYQQVYAYLVNHGYTVITLSPCPRNENWIAHTTKEGFHLQTTILVEGDEIWGTSDVAL